MVEIKLKRVASTTVFQKAANLDSKSRSTLFEVEKVDTKDRYPILARMGSLYVKVPNVIGGIKGGNIPLKTRQS